MKYYAIAQKENVCLGHGSYADEYQISPIGGWESIGSKNFPPIFETTELAEKYMNENDLVGYEVVELNVFEPPKEK